MVLWFWMNYYSSFPTGTAFYLASAPATSTARQRQGRSNTRHETQQQRHYYSLRRRLVVQKSAWKDWGIQWDRISNGLATNNNHQPEKSPSKSDDKNNLPNNDRTLQGLEKMQTEIGALIEDLQNKHDSNGKEAVLQAKLAALSADLEAYRTAAAKAQNQVFSPNDNPAKPSSPAQGSFPSKKSTTKMSRKMRKKLTTQIGRQVFAKGNDDEIKSAPRGRGKSAHVNYGYTTPKPKINGFVDNRFESSASPMSMMMKTAVQSSSSSAGSQTMAPPRPEKMKMAELRDALQEEGVDSNDMRGFRKAELLHMLQRLQRQNMARKSRSTGLRMDGDSSSPGDSGNDSKTTSSLSRSTGSISGDRPRSPQMQNSHVERRGTTSPPMDDLKAFVNGARINDKKNNGVPAANGNKIPDTDIVNGETKSADNLDPTTEPMDPAVKARQEYFKRRIEEARLRAMSSRATKKDTKDDESKGKGQTQSSDQHTDATSQSNRFERDDNQPDIPVVNPEVIVDRYDKSSSPYIIEIKDESIENSPRRGFSLDSRRFGEPPTAAPVNKKAPEPSSKWKSQSPTVFEPIKPPPERRRFGMEPPKEPKAADLPKARIATADTPGYWFGGGPSFAKPPKPFDELFQASERPGMDSPKGPSGSMGPRPARSVAADVSPWQRYGEPLYGEPPRERFGQPPMPNMNGERKSRFGNPPRQKEDDYPRYEEPEYWSKGGGFKVDPQVIQSPFPKPPSNASRMTRSFVDAVVETIEEVMESPDEDESEDETVEETTSGLAEAPVSIWDTPFPVRIEGSELRTWSF